MLPPFLSFQLASMRKYVYLCILTSLFPAVVQEKHINPEEKMPPRNDDPPKKLQNQDTEEVNGMEVDLADGTDEKDPEGSLEANSIDNEDGAAVEPDPLTCEKVDSEETEVPVNTETKSERTGGKRKLQIQGKWKGIDPVIFFNDETIINSIKTFYGIDDSFQLSGQLVSRNGDTNRVKRIYYVSKSVKDALDLNFRVGQQLKITSVGLKMFVSIFQHNLASSRSNLYYFSLPCTPFQWTWVKVLYPHLLLPILSLFVFYSFRIKNSH